MRNIYRIGENRWRYRFMRDGRMVNGPYVATQEEAVELLRLAMAGEFPAVPRKPHACSKCGMSGHYKRTCGIVALPKRPLCKAGDSCEFDEDEPGFCAQLGFCGLIKCWAEDCGAKGTWSSTGEECYCRYHRARLTSPAA